MLVESMTEVAEAAGPEEPARDLRSLRRLTAKLAGIAGSAVSGATLTSPRLRGRTARATSSLRRWILARLAAGRGGHRRWGRWRPDGSSSRRGAREPAI